MTAAATESSAGRPWLNPAQPHPGALWSRPYRARFFRDTGGGFKSLANARVLIYWPHGFGDWIFLSYILPLLEPTNRYWITRFGDDTVCLMEGSEWVTPLYTGVQSPHCDDGGAFQNRHFGVEGEGADGGERDFLLPLPLYEACVKNRIEAVLQADFFETWGHVAFPYHTKARNSVRDLIAEKRLKRVNWGAPLRSMISFKVEPWLARWVEARLRSKAGFGDRKLCLIGRNGYTDLGKNWGHRWREDLPPDKRREGEECRDFMRLMLKRNPRWMFLILEDRLFEGDDTVRSADLNAFSYAELFGEVGNGVLPFGLVLKALVNLADLAVGMPAGPFHLCMAKPELPTVGLWIEHFPSWYDEPKSAAIQVLSRNISEARLTDRPGTFERKENLAFRAMWVDTRVVLGERVLEAVEELVALPRNRRRTKGLSERKASPDLTETTLKADSPRKLAEDFIQTIPPYPGGCSGRGIVIPSGGMGHFPGAWVCLRLLRDLGCELPIQLWHLGQPVCDERMAALVKPFGVECVDAYDVQKRHSTKIFNAGELKLNAMVNDAFKEVLWLDADTVPVINPEFLFETPQFRETGAIVWPDTRRLEPWRSIWNVCGVPYQDEPEFETGQVLVDNEHCWQALNLAMWFNEHSDLFYQHIHGDNETFHMAFRKVNKSYAMPTEPGCLLKDALCQHDFEGRQVFQHRNQNKWSLFDRNKTISGFVHEEQCRKYLAELRAAWRRRIWTDSLDAAKMSGKGKALLGLLTGSVFDYHRVGYDRRPMTFSVDGTLGEGAAGREIFWRLKEESLGAVLEIAGEEDVTCRLSTEDGIIWRGDWLTCECMPIELVRICPKPR